jgi:anti-sigma B factor antagonist
MSDTNRTVTVHLVGLPLDVRRRASDHATTLFRELALVRAGVEAEAGERLRAFADEIQARFSGFTQQQRELLDAAGDEGTIDISYDLPPEVADACERLNTLMDEIDDLCQAGELVTLVATPEARAFRHWFLGEFIAQIREGRPPQPWVPPPADELASRDGPVAVGAADGVPVVAEGDLDLMTAPTVRAAIASRIEAGEGSIVVDLARCTFIDSVGLSLLLTTRERCRAAGGDLRVIGAADPILRLFETVGVRELLVQE